MRLRGLESARHLASDLRQHDRRDRVHVYGARLLTQQGALAEIVVLLELHHLERGHAWEERVRGVAVEIKQVRGVEAGGGLAPRGPQRRP